MDPCTCGIIITSNIDETAAGLSLRRFFVTIGGGEDGGE